MQPPACTDGGPPSPRDIVAAERTLCNGEQRLREILQTAPVAYITVDADGLIVDWNYEAELMFGWPRAQAVGCSLAETVLPAAVRPGYERQLANLAADSHEPTGHLELTARSRDGGEFIADVKIAVVSTEDGHLFDVFVRDISAQCQADKDRRYAEAQLAHQALHDRLTGLPNRTLLLDRLSRALARASRERSIAALIYTDIDQFKLVNDSLGHHAGDELLVQVVNRVKEVLRASDTLLRVGNDAMARLDGDHLAVLCESLSAERDAGGIAERIRSALVDPFVVSDQRVFVKMSMGIAMSTTSSTPGALIRDAETAMYRAKARGGDRCEVFDTDTRERLLARVGRESELRDAIEHQELRLHYQPIVSLRDTKIVGVEALVRWQHPQHGLLPPAQFISIAEDSGLINPLGEWILRHATGQLARWGTAPMRVFVNVSARQLVDMDIVKVVDATLRQTELSPSRLMLEITESSLIDDTDGCIATLHKLHGLGVRLALDDFGTGYSALGYLRSLPFHCLKLDRSFVAGLGQTSTDLEIVGAVIAMARALRMTVVAEGVETETQLNCLDRLGCHLAQGYYFSDPLPADELPLLLRGGSWNGSVSRRVSAPQI